MKELSIFVDESGDFGEYSTHSPFYVISLVLHDQVADLICTLELIKNKIESNNLSKSETLVFHNKKEFRKDFIKKLWKKKI